MYLYYTKESSFCRVFFYLKHDAKPWPELRLSYNYTKNRDGRTCIESYFYTKQMYQSPWKMYFVCQTESFPQMNYSLPLSSTRKRAQQWWNSAQNKVPPSNPRRPRPALQWAYTPTRRLFLPQKKVFFPWTIKALFTSTQKFKIFQNFSSHRIFKRMHKVLNIDENKN